MASGGCYVRFFENLIFHGSVILYSQSRFVEEVLIGHLDVGICGWSLSNPPNYLSHIQVSKQSLLEIAEIHGKWYCQC